jgi:integrase
MENLEKIKKPRRQRGTGSVWQIGPIWWISYYSRGKRTKESSKSRKEKDARDLLKLRLDAIAAGTHDPEAEKLTYNDLRAAFIADYQTKKRRSLRYKKTGEATLAAVERLDEFFLGLKVSEITTRKMKDFQALLQREGLADGSINRSLSALRRMFRLAKEERENFRSDPYFPMLKEATPRTGFFERDEYDRLYAELPDHLKPVLAVAYHTGMRRAEITGLRWDQVDWMNRMIRLLAGETKTGRGRNVPVNEELHAILTALYGKRIGPLVCCRKTGKGKVLAIGDFRKVWVPACVKLSLGKIVDGVYSGKLLHDLRRTHVRNLVRARVPEKVAMGITGHETRSVFDRYNIVDERDLLEAARKLDAYNLATNGPSTVQPEAETTSRKEKVN